MAEWKSKEIETDKEDWNSTCKRFIGMFDIMGFKDLIYRSDHADVMEQMLAIREIATDIESLEEKIRFAQSGIDNVDITRIKSYGLLRVVRPVIFSDSILLVSEDDSVDSAVTILLFSVYLIASAFNKKIPIKGALAYGKQTADFTRSLYFGRPLVDAYTLSEELNMYGAVLHHTIENYLKETEIIENTRIQGVISKSDLPFKKCSVSHYCIDYAPMLFVLSKRNPAEVVSEMRCSVSGSTRIYVDNTLKVLNDFQSIQNLQAAWRQVTGRLGGKKQ